MRTEYSGHDTPTRCRTGYAGAISGSQQGELDVHLFRAYLANLDRGNGTLLLKAADSGRLPEKRSHTVTFKFVILAKLGDYWGGGMNEENILCNLIARGNEIQTPFLDM
jgi:hypothetical protein